MASQALQPLRQTLEAMESFFFKTSNVQGHRVPLRAAATAGLAYILYKAWANYQEWLALGAGGLPHNPMGWIMQWARYPSANIDMTSTDMYDDPAVIAQYGGAALAKRWTTVQLPYRAPRPHVFHFVAPQRQQRPGSSPAIRKLQEEEFKKLAHDNSKIIEVRTSLLERRGSALYLADSVAPVLPYVDAIKREVGHLHIDAEGSSHWTLSPADAKHVIDQGWGQRHMLSGRVPFLPHSYVIIYAPRTEAEVKMQSDIFRASIAFMSGGREVF